MVTYFYTIPLSGESETETVELGAEKVPDSAEKVPDGDLNSWLHAVKLVPRRLYNYEDPEFCCIQSILKHLSSGDF